MVTEDRVERWGLLLDTGATDDQRALLEVSKRFMQDACPLRAVRDGVWKDDEFAAGYRRQAAELGWFSMLVSDALGGGNVSGNGVLDAALIAYARGGLLQPGPFVGTNVTALALSAAGSDEARDRALGPLVAGDVAASWAVAGRGDSRLDGGVDATSTADGGLELTGAKVAVQDVQPSSWILVTCGSAAGPAQALVAADAPGVTVTELESLDLTRRFAEVRFDGTRVPAWAVVGTPGEVDALLTRQLAVACTLIAAEMVGAMDHDFQMTVQYAKDRIAFGRPIGSFQGVKHQLADTSLALEMSKSIALAAARTVGTDGDDHGPQAASMAKAFVGDAGIELVQTCFQVFGGIGYTWEHDQHLFLRRITTDAGLFGDASWHRELLCQQAGL
jgi:alkylation response protein AidB-like acyl-CoA dehydrogenase